MRRRISTIAATLLCSAHGYAATVEVRYEARGEESPTTFATPVGTIVSNGDFTVESCCGNTVMFDATEEYVHWDFDLTSDRNWQRLEILSLTAAELVISWRTGGDTPWDDELQMDGAVTTPFSFVSRFSSYSRTFDLLSLYDDSTLTTSLSDGSVRFRTSNDSLPFFSVLRLESVAIPEPATLTTALMLLGTFKYFRRGSNR